MPEKAALPQFLQRTPEQIAADEQAQEARRAGFTPAHLSEAERLLSRGMQLEVIARANLGTLEDGEERERQSVVLAHALELQGRYEEAAEIHPLEAEAARLRAIHEAVERDDVMCDCPRAEHKLGEAKIGISPRRSLKTIYSRRHLGEVALMVCDACGHLNARPLTGQAAQIHAARAGAGAAGRPSQPDAQLLRA
jgi:hypothetical protein